MEPIADGDALVRGSINYIEWSLLILSGTFIFFNPIPHTTAVKEICFYLILLLSLSGLILKKIQFRFDSPFTFPLALFILWSAASVLWALDRPNTLHDVYAHLIKQAVLYFVIINIFNSEKRLIWLAGIILISISLFALQGIIDQYIIREMPLTSRLRPHAPINASALVNLFGFASSLFFLMRANRPWWIVASILCMIVTLLAVIMSYSRAGLLALVVYAFLFLFMVERKRIAGIVFLLSFVMIVGVYTVPPHVVRRDRIFSTDVKYHARIGIYLTCLEIFKDYPLAGVGYGMDTCWHVLWKEYHPRVPPKWQYQRDASSPHSFFFDLLLRIGIIGVGLFGFLIIKVLQVHISIMRSQGRDPRSWSAYLLPAFVAMLVGGFFGPLLSGPPWLNFFFLLAMTTIVWRLSKGKVNDRPAEMVS